MTEQKTNYDAPRRSISAYMYYAAERRPELKRDQPNLGFGDLTKTIAVEWKSLSPKNQGKWLAMAMRDNKRYQDERNLLNERLEKE